MTSRIGTIAAATACLLMSACQTVPAAKVHPATIALQQAQEAAGSSPWLNQAMVLCSARPPQSHIDAMPALAPTRVFPNLYFVGDSLVSAWALVTPEGIVLIDTLGSQEDAEQIIVAGLQQFGLDAKEITDVIITHGHWDHSAGLPVILAEAPSARVWIGEGDFHSDDLDQPSKASLAGKDVRLIGEDQTTMVGNSGIEIMATPGHSIGTLSLIIPVENDGAEALLAMIGGSSTTRLDHAEHKANAESLTKFENRAYEREVSGVLSNHPALDGSHMRLFALQAQSGANPYLVEDDEIRRWFTIFKSCNEFQDRLLP